ncbi:hypothetical protein N7517_001738 [Penicillium concentricum]|uniref:Uncharacterized protein n=1 Tax=Penicillium concentricum TaxID=293559 RepID=A0A9W9SSJ7_9EURO|nr:uncharacterized protein N7517_001738 [Penicillium concentricum]KAJ5383827.1 hypothetical protein N7517_001738 [Penicillium concentricum]
MQPQSLILLVVVFFAPAPAVADDDICSLNPFEASTWSNSGASDWLENWFKDHDYDEHDWLYKMDAETTGDGDQNSVLDCKGLYSSGTCGGPEVQCKYFTPEQYFYVRQIAAQFNQYMTWAHEMLQDYTISDSLSLDQMISDLDVYNRNEGWMDNLLSTFISLTTIGGVAAAHSSAGTADVLGVLGGALLFTSANNTPDQPSQADIKQKLEAWLEKYFWAVRDNLTKITNRMFGGNEIDSDTDVLDSFLDQLHALGLDNSGQQSKISQVLSSGAFLQSVTQSDITDAIEAGFQQMKKRIIGVLFTTSNVAVNKARMNDGDRYCNGYGNRYIDGHCFMLYYPDGGHMKPVDADVLNKLEFTYGIDPAALYQNVDACDNSFDDGWSNGVELSPDGNGYTPCFFNMIIMREWTGDCTKRNWKFPSWWREIRSDLPCPKGTS